MLENIQIMLLNSSHLFSKPEMLKISCLLKILEITESNNISDVSDISGDIFIKDSTGNITHVISLENKSVITYEEYLKENKEEKENSEKKLYSIYNYVKTEKLPNYMINLDDLDI